MAFHSKAIQCRAVTDRRASDTGASVAFDLVDLLRKIDVSMDIDIDELIQAS